MTSALNEEEAEEEEGGGRRFKRCTVDLEDEVEEFVEGSEEVGLWVEDRLGNGRRARQRDKKNSDRTLLMLSKYSSHCTAHKTRLIMDHKVVEEGGKKGLLDRPWRA